jgi:starch synthase
MDVVFVASEAVPFAKTGGLADVAAALPRALEAQGHHVSLFLPCYRRAWSSGAELLDTGITVRVQIESRMVEGRLLTGRLPGSNVNVYFVDHAQYFDRDGIYGDSRGDYDDNCERFIFFNRAVLEAICLLGLSPDVIHCNDWQTGLIPVYLKTMYREVGRLGNVGTLFTIHNLVYRGIFGRWAMPLTGLHASLFHWRYLEFYDQLSFMKAALVFSDMLSTVSPTYAREIQTMEFGAALDGLLRDRAGDLRGIVNGIDTAIWSPGHSQVLARRYGRDDVVAGKAECKAWLQRHAGLAVRPEVPLFAQIGRLDPQKGWDLLAGVADMLLDQDVQLVVLGDGQPKYRTLFEELRWRHPGRFWAYLGFSDDLAHQIEAGADVFLMPSLYEPCGLNQLYSLAHGTVPLVRATGGLADTVIDATPQTIANGTANGFAFLDPDPQTLWQTIQRALNTWTDRATWQRLVRTGMSVDWSWSRSAREYAALYEEVRRRAHR